MSLRFDRSLLYFLAFVVVVIAAVAASNVWLYRQFSARLDDSLGARLQSTAQAAALLIDGESLVESSGDSTFLNLDYIDLILADRLEEFTTSFGVDEILLMDDEFRLIFDSGETYIVGDPYPYLEGDAGAIQAALEAGRAFSPTTRVRDTYLKRGLALVTRDFGGWSALLVVEADVDFFDLLKTWRRTLVSVTVGVAVVLLLAALLFLRLWMSSERTRRVLIRQDKLATLGRMVSQVAHEIRNPLGIIRISTQRLRRSAAAPDESEMIDYVLGEVDRLDGIVERYLNYAKGQPAEYQETLPENLVDEVLAEFRRSEPGDLDLVKQVSVRGPVRLERARFKQLLFNLIQNAARAGARRVRVVVETGGAGRRRTVRWTVEDDGEGIPRRQQKRVFEPFYTTRPDGSGLGLSIVQQIAEEHGGTVSVQSLPGRGTAVSVAIPAREGKSVNGRMGEWANGRVPGNDRSANGRTSQDHGERGN